MNRFLVVAFLSAVSAAPAPGYAPAAVGYAGGVAAVGPAQVVGEQIHYGQPIARTHVEHGVVGHRAVQVGTQTVVAGQQALIAGQSVHQPAPYTVVEKPAQVSQSTVPVAAPAIPYAAAPALAAIPPPPVNLGPAPADTVTQTKILSPGRVHQVITPQRTVVEPQLQVNKVPYDVPVAIPVPVQRDVIVTKKVQKPYTVEVPVPAPYAAPYEVNPVINVHEQPIVKTQTYSHSVAAPVAVAHAAPVAVAAAPAVAVKAGY